MTLNFWSLNIDCLVIKVLKQIILLHLTLLLQLSYITGWCKVSEIQKNLGIINMPTLLVLHERRLIPYRYLELNTFQFLIDTDIMSTSLLSKAVELACCPPLTLSCFFTVIIIKHHTFNPVNYFHIRQCITLWRLQ